MPLDRRSVLRGGAVLGLAGVAGLAVREVAGSGPEASRSAAWGDQPEPTPYEDYAVHRVGASASATHETIQGAVAAATPHDLVLIEPGEYAEAVTVTDTPNLTIRGLDRDAVRIDGGFGGRPCITARSDGVVVENLTVTRGSYGVYWAGVTGYRASHVIAYNNSAPGINGYGIYAFNARAGRFEHCYASGSDDAGFYIGESQPADAVITDCLAEHNALGYSGTNAGGNLVIRDSTFRDNMTGIVPNTLDSQEGAPQGHIAGGVRIEHNEVVENNNLSAPAFPIGYPIFGNGITIAGGHHNDVVANEVRGHANYGIAVTPMIDEQFYRPRANAVEDNRVGDSGRADLGLAAPAAENAFANNRFATSRPAGIERRDGSFGDPWVFLTLLKNYAQTELGEYHRGEVATQPPPDPDTLAELPPMTDPEDRPPATPIGGI